MDECKINSFNNWLIGQTKQKFNSIILKIFDSYSDSDILNRNQNFPYLVFKSLETYCNSQKKMSTNWKVYL